MVPSGARPDLRLLRAAFALSSTATRASPLRVRGGITRDRALSTCRCAELVGEIGFLVAGGGGRAVHTPACAVPPLTARGRRGTGGLGRAAVGSRSHPPPRFPRALRRVCVPPMRVHVPATLAARSCRVWCVPRALGRLRLPPRPPLPRQRSHGRWRSREPSYPPLPPPRGSRGSVNRGVWPRSRGADFLFGGTGGRPRPARRRTLGPAATRGSSSVGVGVCLGSLSRRLASPRAPGGVRWFRVGSVPRAWRDCSGLGAV